MAEVETLGAAAIATLVLGSGGVIGFFRLLNEMRAQNRMEREQRRSEFDGIRNEMRLDRQEARAGRQEERTQYTTFFGTYDRSIAALKIQYDSETDAARKTAFKEQLDKMADEYHIQLEAYRQSSTLRQSVPAGAAAVEQPPLAEDRRVELEELLEKAEPLNPALLTADDYYARGIAAYRLDLYETALAHFDRAATLRPNDTDTLSYRGATLFQLKRYDEALSAYNRALDIKPDDPDTLSNRGATLAILQRYDEALADHNRAFQLRPDHPGTLYNRACTFSLMERYDESLQWLEKAIARDPSYRQMARDDEDFANLRSDPTLGPEFQRLVAEPEE